MGGKPAMPAVNPAMGVEKPADVAAAGVEKPAFAGVCRWGTKPAARG